jgi:hypothetical protein
MDQDRGMKQRYKLRNPSAMERIFCVSFPLKIRKKLVDWRVLQDEDRNVVVLIQSKRRINDETNN